MKMDLGKILKWDKSYISESPNKTWSKSLETMEITESYQIKTKC